MAYINGKKVITIVAGGGSGGLNGEYPANIPTVETLENPTAQSPTFVFYKGELYVLVNDEEEK